MSLVRTIRQKLNIDSDTPLDLSAWRNNSTIFQIAVYQGTTVADISDVESINLKIRSSRVSETILADQTDTVFDETLTNATWLDGTKQHASFTFTNSEMNLDLDDQYEAEFWIVFTAILDGGEERTLATGTITFKEDNNGAGDPPAENPGTAITIEQADVRYATAAQGTDERVPTAAGLTSKFATNKATIIDADKVAIFDSAASDAPKHSLFSLVKSTLKTYFDTFYVTLTGNQTIAGNKTFSGTTEAAGINLTADSTLTGTLTSNTLDGVTGLPVFQLGETTSAGSFLATNSGGFQYYDTSAFPTIRTGSLVSPSLTGNRTWTFKDASGTVAFTSDITAVTPTITGTAYLGQTLTSTAATQWLANGEIIQGQTGSTYLVKISDLGKTIRQRGSNSLTVSGVARYSKKYWTALTDFTTTGSAPSTTSDRLRFSAAFGNFDTTRILLSTIRAGRDYTFTVKLKMVNITDYGLSIGSLSVNAWSGQAKSIAWTLRPSTPANDGFYAQFSGAIGTGLSGMTGDRPAISAGDTITAVFRHFRGIITVEVTNNTTGLTGTRTITANKNTGRIGVCGLGSTFEIIEMTHLNDFPANPRVIAIGDSKTAASSLIPSYTDLLTDNGIPVACFANPSERTVELVQAKADYITTGAKVAVMCIGRNDLASAVSSGTWQANYASIVADLKNAGMSVIHLVIPEITQNQSTLQTYLDATYPNDTREYLAGWVNATYLDVDNIHPNAAGQVYIESILRPVIQGLL